MSRLWFDRPCTKWRKVEGRGDGVVALPDVLFLTLDFGDLLVARDTPFGIGVYLGAALRIE